jgi:DNA-binding NarL/FixJ family response regulator
VRELSQTSAEVVFEDLGTHQLKGVAEPRRLFAVTAIPVKVPEYPDRLSAREVEVLRLISGGRSNAEIAAALVISPNTVLRHVSNILDKTGAANRTEAAAYAVRNGLIQPATTAQ